MLLAGIQPLQSRDLPIVSLDARQKRSGMTFAQLIQPYLNDIDMEHEALTPYDYASLSNASSESCWQRAETVCM